MSKCRQERKLETPYADLLPPLKQAYTTTDSESLISVGVCDTRAVLECWRGDIGSRRWTHNAEFFAMNWDKMSEAGWDVFAWRASNVR